MKKNIIVLLLLITSVTAIHPLPISQRTLTAVKKLVLCYADHTILDYAHAAGHHIVSQMGLLLGLSVHEYYDESDHILKAGDRFVQYEFKNIPYLKIPIRIRALSPDFKNENFVKTIDFSGPAAGLLACYIRLKIANIYSEYSSKKTFIQNIKDGLAKPFYKGHSPHLTTIVTLHAFKNAWEIIPGNHQSKFNIMHNQ